MEISEGWAKIREIFGSARKPDAADRRALLDQSSAQNDHVRADVDSLLATHDEAPGPSNDPFATAVDAAAEAKTIGPYRLIHRLGVGGMGQVWLAEQTEPVKRQVALKLIKAGLYDDAVAQRFLAERQSLAMMGHPAIAKVFDAGATSAGQPYLAMEYVDGLPLTDYCDQKKLSVHDRLRLFLQVCEGVQHAHQKAIIHRDLKPSNILVTEVDGRPTPRIIDFGLAKFTTPVAEGETVLTQFGAFLGTPGYMSPEQVDPAIEDVDTRADVYSLGVILYELLTGVLPFDTRQWKNQRFDEILTNLRQADPARPSTKVRPAKNASSIHAVSRNTDPRQLALSLRGDLDSITLKALENDRDRRYRGPFDLAADIERYLENRPVLARPASSAYLLRKYLHRHRLAVGLSVIAAVLFISFAIVQAIQLRRTTKERDRADRVAAFVTQMFQLSDPGETRGNTITAREILDRSSADIDKSLVSDPELRASMMLLMGRVYYGLGLYPKAQTLLQQGLEIDGRTLGPNNGQVIDAKSQLASALALQGQFKAAEKLAREASDQASAQFGLRNARTLKIRHNLAAVLMRDTEDHSAEAAAVSRVTVDVARSLLGPKSADTANYTIPLATSLSTLGKYREAEALFRDAVDTERKVYGADDPRMIFPMTGFANSLFLAGKLAEAEKVMRQVLDLARRLFGPDHPDTLLAASDLATYISEEGHDAEAARIYRDILERQRRILGPDQPYTLVTMGNLANSLAQLGQYAEADDLQKETLERSRRIYGDHDLNTSTAAYNLACQYALQGRAPEALSYLEESIHDGLAVHTGLKVGHDEDLKSLRGNPRFEALATEAHDLALQAQTKN